MRAVAGAVRDAGIMSLRQAQANMIRREGVVTGKAKQAGGSSIDVIAVADAVSLGCEAEIESRLCRLAPRLKQDQTV